MWQDLRYGLRIFSRNPGFAIVAIVALALGIGANATVFAIANPIFFKNLPFDGSGDLLYFTSKSPVRPDRTGGVSRPDYDDLRAGLKSFRDIGATSRTSINLSDAIAVPEFHTAARLTANGFTVLEQKPILGRGFLPADEQPGAAPVAILTWKLWDKRYAKDPGIIGQTIRLDSVPATVVGVMPKFLEFPIESELWTNLVRKGDEPRDQRTLTVFAKLAPGVSLAAAQTEMRMLSDRLASAHPAENRGVLYQAKHFHDVALQGGVKSVITLLLGAVGFVLLIACANVANLLLSRAAGRAREIGIRTALGAGRWRLVRQMLAESLLLAVAGGIFGWGLSILGVRAFDAATANSGKPEWIDFSPDYHSFVWLAAITLLTAFLFGLAPAMRLSRITLNDTLKDGGRGAGGSIRGRYFTSALVVIEMTLSVVLLIAAGLMMRSFMNTYSRPLGVVTSNLLTLRLDLPSNHYPGDESQQQFRRKLSDRLQSLAGVESVTFAGAKHGSSFVERYELEGAPPEPKQFPRTDFLNVGDGYFETLRLTARQGRLLNATDYAGGPFVAVVNETTARQLWPKQNPIGKRFRPVSKTRPSEWTTVIGTVPDFLPDLQNGEAQPVTIIPFRQRPDTGLVVLVRTKGSPSALSNSVRRELQALDPDLPAHDIGTMDEDIALNRWPLRVFGSMFAIFAAIALLLATVGLYAVVAYSVSLRTQEIGVRVALGASSASVARMVLITGARQAAVGLALGLAAAFAVTRLMKALLVGVAPSDPLTFGVVGAVLLAATLLGCLLPARRAARVDPVVALRCD